VSFRRNLCCLLAEKLSDKDPARMTKEAGVKMLVRTYLKRLIVFLTIITATACYEPPTKPEFKDTLILGAYLYVGQPVDSIFLGKSLPIGVPYSDARAAVQDAQITLSRGSKHYVLSEYDQHPGVYYLPADSLIIEASESYDIDVRFADHHLRASTTAPGQISLQLKSANKGH